MKIPPEEIEARKKFAQVVEFLAVGGLIVGGLLLQDWVLVSLGGLLGLISWRVMS